MLCGCGAWGIARLINAEQINSCTSNGRTDGQAETRACNEILLIFRAQNEICLISWAWQQNFSSDMTVRDHAKCQMRSDPFVTPCHHPLVNSCSVIQYNARLSECERIRVFACNACVSGALHILINFLRILKIRVTDRPMDRQNYR